MISKSKIKTIYDFINAMDYETFVSLHQDSFKDHYLSQPNWEFLQSIIVYNGTDAQDYNFLYDDLDLFSVIREKYAQFFEAKGLDESLKWCNGFTIREMSAIMGLDVNLSDDEYESLCDKEAELYDDFWSGWALPYFLIEVLEMMDMKDSTIKDKIEWLKEFGDIEVATYDLDDIEKRDLILESLL